MSETKKIAVLTSGGDCAGLNAAIRGVVHAGRERGWTVIGIEDGTAGLYEKPYRVHELRKRDFDGRILREGGTILGSISKGNPFAHTQAVLNAFKELEIDAIVVIGGDGSFGIMSRLAEEGDLKVIGIPKTIDNDLGKTEVCIGFDTAVSVASEALDRLQPTAASHQRVMVLEVMGRDAGHIALNAGIAGGADVILIPEIPYDIEKVCEKIRSVREDEGRNHSLVVVSEAVKNTKGETLHMKHADGRVSLGGIGQAVGHEIAERTGADTRVTVLGHVQRGAPPTATDRLIGTAFGTRAVELIEQGKSNLMVAWRNREVIDVPFKDAIETYHNVNTEGSIVKAARSMGISFGD